MSRFCTECGVSTNDEEQFCPSCGAKLASATGTPPQVQVEETAVVTRASPRVPMPVWKKITYSLLLIVVAAGVGGHFFIKSITSPDKTIQPIYNALLNNDEKLFFENITVPKEVAYDPQSYMEYINDQEMDSFFITLMDNANNVHSDGIIRIIEHEDGSELFRIKSSKLLFFYPVVEVLATSSDVLLETDLKNGIFTFNEKEFPLKGENLKIGTFLPGSYTVTAMLDDPFIPNSSEWAYYVDTTEKTNKIPLMSSETMINLDSEELDSIVYINGISTKKTISDMKTIGPIFGDTQIEMYTEKETPTGEVAKSNEEIGVGGSDINFSYTSNYSFVEKTPEDIAAESFDEKVLEQFVLDFRDSYGKSLMNKDFDAVRSYLAPDSTAYKELEDFIGNLGNDYYNYDFTLNEITKTEVTPEEAFVSTYEEFIFTNHNNDVTHYERDKQYDIQLNDENEFEIHKIHIFDTKRNR